MVSDFVLPLTLIYVYPKYTDEDPECRGPIMKGLVEMWEGMEEAADSRKTWEELKCCYYEAHRRHRSSIVPYKSRLMHHETGKYELEDSDLEDEEEREKELARQKELFLQEMVDIFKNHGIIPRHVNCRLDADGRVVADDDGDGQENSRILCSNCSNNATDSSQSAALQPLPANDDNQD